MTDEVRAKVRGRLEELGISQRQLAQRLGRHPQYIWDVLNGKSGNIPKSWRDILAAVGLELTVRPVEDRGPDQSRPPEAGKAG